MGLGSSENCVSFVMVSIRAVLVWSGVCQTCVSFVPVCMLHHMLRT